jgi:hypothetical protein
LQKRQLEKKKFYINDTLLKEVDQLVHVALEKKILE